MASATPTSGIAPLTVNFSSAGSNDPDGSIASYSWNFGDGSAASTSASPSHVYQNPGNYTAVLTVTDNRGATGTAPVAITANPDPNVINAPSNLTGSGGKGTAKEKYSAMAAAGIHCVQSPADIGQTLAGVLGKVTSNR